MQTAPDAFAHVLLFACPQCGSPLASACASTRKNLEVADAHWFNPHCHCGWTGPVIGVHALRHWVEPWRFQSTQGRTWQVRATANRLLNREAAALLTKYGQQAM
jgi:predicted RNA-binding Zn-ribbon protein involved in translation (DUF1610 family)